MEARIIPSPLLSFFNPPFHQEKIKFERKRNYQSHHYIASAIVELYRLLYSATRRQTLPPFIERALSPRNITCTQIYLNQGLLINLITTSRKRVYEFWPPPQPIPGRTIITALCVDERCRCSPVNYPSFLARNRDNRRRRV